MKECCATCADNEPENGPGDVPFCSWYGEVIDDENNETCFEWYPKMVG